MKKLPYGISNFAIISQDDYLYIDKTRFIEILEKESAPYQFFIRPRRFGKSLFISLMENYYDIKKKEQFCNLFAGKYIGKHPTILRNSFLILKFSFAAIVTCETRNRLIESFDDCVRAAARHFINYYKEYLPGNTDYIINSRGAEGILRNLINIVHNAGQQLFVLIDEYDNFANGLIASGNNKLYYDLLRSEGYVRAFYKALKDGTQSGVSRIFITGVSPIMLDDLTSGFNITVNFTNNENYNDMMGFTEDEVKQIVHLYRADGWNIFRKEGGSAEHGSSSPVECQDSATAKILTDMKRYYNGYLFSEYSRTHLYNPDMVLYFMDNLVSRRRYPAHILDDNVKVDYRKIRQLAFNFKDEELIEKILKNGEATSTLVSRFPLEEMFKKRENFISVLYYLGMLTIKEQDENELVFCIPNYVIRTIYWDYFLDRIERDVTVKADELRQSMKRMRIEGDISYYINYLQLILEKLSNRDLQKFDEKYIRAVMLTLFNVDGVYLIETEYETEHGYIDILLTRDIRYDRWINYEWLIEIKYLKEKERGRLGEVLKAARRQLGRYTTETIKGRIAEESLKKVIITVIGKSEIITEME